jgi:hypothetical protein
MIAENRPTSFIENKINESLNNENADMMYTGMGGVKSNNG